MTTANESAFPKEVKPKKTTALCSGCYNNDYNYGLGGAKKCWSFKTGKVIKRLMVYSDQSPPYDKDRAVYKMSCYRQTGRVWVEPKVLDHEGYWK